MTSNEKKSLQTIIAKLEYARSMVSPTPRYTSGRVQTTIDTELATAISTLQGMVGDNELAT